MLRSQKEIKTIGVLNGTDVVRVTNGIVNEIVVTHAISDSVKLNDSFIQVVLNRGEETIVLVSRMCVEDFMCLQGLKQGFNPIELIGNGSYGKIVVPISIPVGCVHLEDGSLEITLESNGASLGVSVVSYSDDVDFLYSYIKTDTFTNGYKNVGMLLYVTGEAITVDNKVNVNMTVDNERILYGNLSTFNAVTNLKYKVENVMESKVSVLFEDMNFYNDVDFNITDAHSGDYLIVVKKDLTKFSSETLRKIQLKQAKLVNQINSIK